MRAFFESRIDPITLSVDGFLKAMSFRPRTEHQHLDLRLSEGEVDCLLPARVCEAKAVWGVEPYLGLTSLVAFAERGTQNMVRLSHVPDVLVENLALVLSDVTRARYSESGFAITSTKPVTVSGNTNKRCSLGESIYEIFVNEKVISSLANGNKFIGRDGKFSFRIEPPEYSSMTSEWRRVA